MKDTQQTPSSGDDYPILKSLSGAKDLRKLGSAQLEALASEIRQRLINVTSINGGHLGPNLGVVELTIALHLVFDTPRDQFVFDTSHQGYVHKLLTGRNGPEFDAIRTSKGLSGFLSRDESEHDAFGAGHAGTALSAALGMAAARDRLKSKDHVVAVCGDAAFTCGITMEALNNVAAATKRLVIVLNDNEWSIAKNVGAISKYLNELITNPIYNRLHHDVGSLLAGAGERMPRIQVIVGNDGGGSIFDALEVAGTADPAAFDRVQFTPHAVDLAALARAYGWEYARAGTAGALDAALTSTRPGPVLIGVPLAR